MQDVAQLVRALVCGAGGRGFEPHLPAKSLVEQTRLFCCYIFNMINLFQIKSLVTIRYRKTTFIVVTLMYIVGTLGLILPCTQPYLKLAAPFNLWVSLILLLLFHQQVNKSFIVTSIGIFLAGFFIEVIGVQSGLIFGKYWYGQTLGTKVLGVPLVIGANWLLLIYCSNIVTIVFFELFKNSTLKKSILDYTFTKATFASLLMVCLDYLIEPVAIHLDFWHWQFEKIPFQNFQAWFVIAFLLSCIFLNSKFQKLNPLATLLFALQFLFFISINIFKMLF
jgi:putative membrane protein